MLRRQQSTADLADLKSATVLFPFKGTLPEKLQRIPPLKKASELAIVILSFFGELPGIDKAKVPSAIIKLNTTMVKKAAQFFQQSGMESLHVKCFTIVMTILILRDLIEGSPAERTQLIEQLETRLFGGGLGVQTGKDDDMWDWIGLSVGPLGEDRMVEQKTMDKWLDESYWFSVACSAGYEVEVKEAEVDHMNMRILLALKNHDWDPVKVEGVTPNCIKVLDSGGHTVSRGKESFGASFLHLQGRQEKRVVMDVPLPVQKPGEYYVVCTYNYGRESKPCKVRLPEQKDDNVMVSPCNHMNQVSGRLGMA